MPLSIAIHGAGGRMGRRLVALGVEDPGLRVVAAVEHAGHSLLGQDAGVVAGGQAIGVALQDRLASRADVLIDFSSPAATAAILTACVDAKTPIVIGTTGLGAAENQAIDAAAKKTAVLQAPNMSLGVNLLITLAGQIARQLGPEYDIEITESHHRFKKDAPSGTAMGIASAICAATGRDIQKDLAHGRHGPDAARQPGQIGMHAMRMGDVVGEHTVSYATLGERLEVTHVATTRDVFARGALRAAKWLAGKPPGRYSMIDVLGLK